MKTPLKILLFLFSLLSLAGTYCLLSLFYPLPFLTYFVGGIQALSPVMRGVFAGFSAFLCLCFLGLLLLSLFWPRQSDNVILLKGKGVLTFSKQAVESTIRYSFADVSGIRYCKIKTKIYGKPEKTRVRVKLVFADTDKLVELTETIWGRIENALKTSLDITAKTIQIEVAGAGPDREALVNQIGDRVV